MKIKRTPIHNAPGRIPEMSITQIFNTLFLMCVLLLSIFNPVVASAPDPALKLTQEEINWLNKNKDNIRYGPNPHWPPGDYMEAGEHKGIVSDYIKIFEKKLGITFKRVYYDNWEDFYNGMMTGEFDLVGAAQETEARKKVLVFTEPFLETRLAVLTRANGPALNSLDDLNSMTLAGIKGYSSLDYVKRKYPGAKIIECDDDLTVLLKVSAGAADGAIVDYMMASYLVDKYSITNIKYAKELDFHWDLRFAINKKMPQLRSILDKVLGSISKKERQDIYHKWVSIKFEHNPSFFERHLKVITGIFSFILFLLFVVIFFNRSLKRQVLTRTKELEENSEKLQESKESLQAVLDSAGDTIIVNNADTGQIIHVNHRMIEMYGYSYEEALAVDFKKLSLGEPPFSQVEALEWFDKAREIGPQTFEWMSRHKYGHTFWVEVKVNFAVIGGGNRFVIVVRDITERKKKEETLRSSLAEKDVLLKEIHHRVKNNMQVISSLVDLQAEEVKDEAMCDVFRDVVHRVRSMAMVHEKLYQSEDFARVEFADYTRSLLGYLWRAQGTAKPGLDLEMDLHPVYLPVSEAVPCGLMLNELFTNALKHAFVGRSSGKVTVSLGSNAQRKVVLSVKDDGIGLPPEMDVEKAFSLGLRLVQILAIQLHACVVTQTDHGTTFTITFEAPES